MLDFNQRINNSVARYDVASGTASDLRFAAAFSVGQYNPAMAPETLRFTLLARDQYCCP